MPLRRRGQAGTRRAFTEPQAPSGGCSCWFAAIQRGIVASSPPRRVAATAALRPSWSSLVMRAAPLRPRATGFRYRVRQPGGHDLDRPVPGRD